MYQDFSAPPENSGDPKRIEALRSEMKNRGVDGFIVPRADEFQGEYVPAHAERLAWLTGFTGSAGDAVILTDKAAIFIDGRYTLQVRDQVDIDVLEPVSIMETSVAKWLSQTVEAGQKIAFDPWLHTVKGVKALKDHLSKVGATLVESENLIDRIWHDQPEPPKAPLRLQPLEYAGQPAGEKIAAVQNEIAEKGASAFVLTQPDSIAWLLNIRGGDVPHTPLVLCFAIIPKTGKPTLFIDPDKYDGVGRDYLSAYVDLMPQDQLLDKVLSMDGPIGLDFKSACEIIHACLVAEQRTMVEMDDPCTLMKACKNEAELKGTRGAHIRDGVAMARFLYWLDREPIENLDEISAAQRLEEFRRQTGDEDQIPLEDLSFDTISGFGSNGAIVHYRVTEDTNKAFEKDTLYLVDSGGQYQDGTTDITRTIAIGEPSLEMMRNFTLVLKGMIAISRVRFPKGTSGAQIDAFARQALWQEGLDYDHGTGHGVGSFLSVHEGPQRISKVSHLALKPGMILSNEPGYYKAGAYGIRIENLIVVDEASEIEGGERPMMGFETITFAPIDRRLIDLSLLDSGERDWLNVYHSKVFEKVSSRLNADETDWLKAATAPI